MATDNCAACNALREECGEHFDLYARKLLIRGWAGVMSPVERAYYRAHRSAAQQAQADALAARKQGFQRRSQTHASGGETGESGVEGQVSE
jgi:hypothetical protein